MKANRRPGELYLWNIHLPFAPARLLKPFWARGPGPGSYNALSLCGRITRPFLFQLTLTCAQFIRFCFSFFLTLRCGNGKYEEQNVAWSTCLISLSDLNWFNGVAYVEMRGKLAYVGWLINLNKKFITEEQSRENTSK